MEQSSSLKARQIRAARALLDWSQDDLADASSLSIATIRKLELGYISPRSQTMQLIRSAFEDAGLEFLEPDGVRHRLEEITVYQGIEQVRSFYDDVYQTVHRKGGDIVIVSTDPNLMWKMMGSYADIHRQRMEAIKNTFRARCLITEEVSQLPAPSYCKYRMFSKSYVDSVPFYVYGDKYAIRTLQADPAPKIVVVQSQAVADSFRHQFNSMWEKATPLKQSTEKPSLTTKIKKRR